MDEGFCDRTLRPVGQEVCGMDMCRETVYDINYFDSKALRSGMESEVHLEHGENAFFSFEKPNAATKGVCLVARSRAPTETKCSIEAEREVSACNSGMLGCLHMARAENEGAVAAGGEALANLTRVASGCHAEHIACV